jgi:hypothetical protein
VENPPFDGGFSTTLGAFSATLDGIFPVYIRKMQFSDMGIAQNVVLSGLK